MEWKVSDINSCFDIIPSNHLTKRIYSKGILSVPADEYEMIGKMSPEEFTEWAKKAEVILI